ncbi:MAG: hypothetical protein JW723_12300 [Bacteroidales bacterium]|nr:hypothetical protein [Bacteroidales bacterium]
MMGKCNNNTGENKQLGWVQLHRKSWDNFLYKERRAHTRREAWEDIIVFVNHKDSFVLIGNEKIECKRGQSIQSLDSWAKIFNWSKSKVRRFFSLLSKEEMIVVENLQKTTRITVCNYEYYQRKRNADETQVKRKRNASDTKQKLKNDKNVKNEKKERENIPSPSEIFKKDIIPLFDIKPETDSQFKAWCECYRSLIDSGKYTHNKIVEIVNWARTNSYWKPRFLSFLKLKEVDRHGILFIDRFKSEMNSDEELDAFEMNKKLIRPKRLKDESYRSIGKN